MILWRDWRQVIRFNLFDNGDKRSHFSRFVPLHAYVTIIERRIDTRLLSCGIHRKRLNAIVSMDVSLRRLRAEDIDQVIEIEREAFSPLWVSSPFKRELNNRYASYLVASEEEAEEGTAQPGADSHPEPGADSVWDKLSGGVRKLVGRSPSESALETFIAGYVSVWYQGEEAHITEIAVRESLRGNGIGELLLIGSLRAAMEYGSQVMTLEVRVSNFVAQRLYEKYGFNSVGLRKGYYSDNREDAAIMTTNPINTSEYRQKYEELKEIYLAKRGPISENF